MTTKARPKTHVAIILDKSGSMAATKTAAISGFNEQVQQLKEDSKTQDILCSLVTFNGEVFEHLWNVPAEQLVEANPDDFQPNGNTAMQDAVGYTVQKLLNTTDHEDLNTAYLIVTISDGQTNMDKHYNPDTLRELVQGCEATKKWTFTYMGCGKEYMQQLSRSTGTSASNMGQWSNSTAGGARVGMSNLRSRQKKFFAERAMGQTASPCYASDSLGEVADYESAPVEAAPAPVISDLAAAAKMNWPELSNKLPKYESQASPAYNGGPMFANAVQVRWEAAAQDDLASQHALGGIMNCAMPQNRAVSLAAAPAVAPVVTGKVGKPRGRKLGNVGKKKK